MSIDHSRLVSAARLREVLVYEPESGEFHWKAPTYAKIQVGTKAGGINRGYIRIAIDRRRYMAHRLAWLYMYGEWPTGEVDHQDGNRQNNAISNLRDVSRSVNQQNQRKPRADNRHGFLGVHRQTRTGKFEARIRTPGGRKRIGSFDTPEEAHAAYVEAKRLLHPGCML